MQRGEEMEGGGGGDLSRDERDGIFSATVKETYLVKSDPNTL